MFISNNRPSFHLWWKEKLVKHQKVSKYYETDCRLIITSGATVVQKNRPFYLFNLVLEKASLYATRNVPFYILKSVLKKASSNATRNVDGILLIKEFLSICNH